MIANRRALQDKFAQLRIRARVLEKQREQASKREDTTAYYDACVALKNTHAEIQRVLGSLTDAA